MKNIFNNLGYFLREVKTILKLNAMSNFFSLLSTSLIFFILAMVISGWWISSQVVEAIQGETEISVYYKDDIDNIGAMQLVEKLKNIDGVRESRLVDEEEAYGRMVEILGKDARALEYFDENPFSPFIEVKIHIDEMNVVLESIGKIAGIEHVRDNREILERLQDIAQVLRLIGYLVIAAVGITTLVIISHIIRMGINDNKEQINTLRLMGAPEAFIGFPFLLEGLALTVGGGVLASTLAAFTLKYVYAQMAGPLPFIPLPSQETLLGGLFMIVMSLSVILGVAGSIFGLESARKS
jgi:cell division transport system permease protein